MGYRIGVDVGGTFTDVVAYDEKSRRCHVTKLSSVPQNPAIAVIDGIEKICKKVGIKSEEITYVIHGTTVATNALLERKGARTALVTTAGFRDVFEIGRQRRPDLYNFWIKRPKPPIPRYLIFEASERVLYDGTVEQKLDEAQAKEVIREIRKQNIESIAVCFIHSYINPVNEKRMKELILKEIPDAFVSISYEILPEIREFERVCTTAVNAYLMPKVRSYINDLEKRKNNLGIKPKIHVMQSNGGVMSSQAAAQRSIHTVFSGPAGGVLGSLHLAKLIGEDNIITLDMGGTSTDIALLEKGQLRLTTEGEIGTFPIKVPMIEMHTIGAGGGSIAWIDSGGALRVGPQSAGADPGPACYGRGDYPTVTDANLVLGRIDPNYFLGGEIKLSLDKAKQAIEKHLVPALGLSVFGCARGIIRIVNANMGGGVNVVSTQKGYDLREFTLVAFGGAAALHAAQLMDDLKMKKTIIPQSPANFAAIGAELADVRYDYVRTIVKSVNSVTIEAYNQMYREMKKEALVHLIDEGFGENEIIFSGSSDMRYGGQSWELSIPTPIELPSADFLKKIAENFHKTHEKTYGYRLSDEDIIFVNLRLSATGKIPKIRFVKEPPGKDTSKSACKNMREVYFVQTGEKVKCPIYDREKLTPGSTVAGPAVIEEYASNTVLPRGKTASIDEYRNIIIKSVKK
jgi:N-methylhydantoinase A